jgi:hypothetical protein
MRWVVATALVASGCSFDPRGISATGAVDAAADAMVDATVDARVDAMVDADPCPMGYAPITGGEPGSQYRFATTSTDWMSAEMDCEHDGRAHLVVLDNDGERDAVRGKFTGDAWTGATDLVSQFTWFKVTTGVDTYLPWDSGEPNNQGGNERCLELKGGGFNDESCDEGNVYVCECDGLAANPVAYTPP